MLKVADIAIAAALVVMFGLAATRAEHLSSKPADRAATAQVQADLADRLATPFVAP
jgi:hypothetical protein